MSKELQLQNHKLDPDSYRDGLSSLSDAKTIERLISIKQEVQQDFWDELSEAEKQSIEQGIKDADEGRLVPHTEIRKKYDKWL
jgi:predicted transcriptional regulator